MDGWMVLKVETFWHLPPRKYILARFGALSSFGYIEKGQNKKMVGFMDVKAYLRTTHNNQQKSVFYLWGK